MRFSDKMDVITTFVNNFDYTNEVFIRFIECIIHYCVLMFCYESMDARMQKTEAKMQEMDGELIDLAMEIEKEKKTLDKIYHKIDDLSDFIRNKVVLKKNKDV